MINFHRVFWVEECEKPFANSNSESREFLKPILTKNCKVSLGEIGIENAKLFVMP